MIFPDISELVKGPDAWFRSSRKTASGTVEIRNCECLVEGCLQHYSSGCGYFYVERNDDDWKDAGSASVQIRRHHTQVICGEHGRLMFLESFNPKTKVENFRCPQRDCQQTVKILAAGPPAYWLGEGFFKAK